MCPSQPILPFRIGREDQKYQSLFQKRHQRSMHMSSVLASQGLPFLLSFTFNPNPCPSFSACLPSPNSTSPQPIIRIRSALCRVRLAKAEAMRNQAKAQTEAQVTSLQWRRAPWTASPQALECIGVREGAIFFRFELYWSRVTLWPRA